MTKEERKEYDRQRYLQRGKLNKYKGFQWKYELS